MHRICLPWDRLLWLSDERFEAIAQPGERDDEVRLRVRIERVEEALARSRADPFVGLLWLGDDLVRRRARWAHIHPTRATRRRHLFGWSRQRLAGALIIAGVLAALSMVLAWAAGVLALLLFVPLVWSGRSEDAEPASFDMHRCPDCGYDLTGVPDAIPAERVGGRTGPRACPECGAAWPLVPPPA